MTLKSALEDLQERTLNAVSGLLGKLDYLASLRESDGSYSHWGLERVHGKLATQRALTEAHRSLVSRILRTPLRELLQDVDESSPPKELASGDFVEKLNETSAQLIPPGPGAGIERHLNSVLHALVGLVRTRQ